ncbi:MAG: glycoside hydrolase family 3 C-terminal domain-containing protein [Clostridia bacterium]|nr:glycoside hydrolase family 3 C-terminal domain-containing protein [Clostridia bacterium]
MIGVSNLTLSEKLRLLTGKNLWQTEDLDGKVPSVFFADGPHGLRKMKMNEQGRYENIPFIAYPNLVNLANSWDVNAAKKIGECIGEDCIENNVQVLLAPGVNIKRTPLCGRNFEYFSEDPLLAGKLAKAYITGVQSKGVGACIKHFCVNNREIGRYYQSSEVDERTLHEIYLKPFRIAREAEPWAIMTSYNPVNGIYAAENKKLLTDILRKKFKFNGLVISDWEGVHMGYRALKAGLDLRMPMPYHKQAYNELFNAYEKGWITDEEIDNAVSNILRFCHKATSSPTFLKMSRIKRREIGLKAALGSIVLLKNENVLPITAENIVVVGELNSRPHVGGGGAACVVNIFPQFPLNELLSERLNRPVQCTKHVYLDSLNPSHNDREGALAASKSDLSIVIVGNDTKTETEGADRESIRLSEKEERLILSVAKAAPKTVVVIEAGSAIDMSAWIDQVDGVVFAGFLGDNANEALADILSGKVCPSGKLSETFPTSIENTYCGTQTGNGYVERYTDGVFVGYRYYDAFKKEVLFPFGFGLSYAKFEYSNLKIDRLEEDTFEVSYDVTNVSSVEGKEISQVYVKDVCSMVSRPEKELAAFAKTSLKPHETKRVSHILNKEAFSYYCVNREDWVIENGEFDILIGASSRDIRLSDRITITLSEETQPSYL